VRGALFVDLGSAFDDWGALELWQREPELRLRDLHAGFGVRARVAVGRLDLRLSAGWPTDLREVGPARITFTIGSGELF
jgi:hypothetical protein